MNSEPHAFDDMHLVDPIYDVDFDDYKGEDAIKNNEDQAVR